MASDRTNSTAMERHAATIMIAVIISLLGWTGYTLNLLLKEATAVSVEMQNIKSEITLLRASNKMQYTIVQAQRDFDVMYKNMDKLEYRIRDLESKQR